MKSRFSVSFSTIIILMAFGLVATVNLRESSAKACPPGHRWIPKHRSPGGKLIAGHCKPLVKAKVIEKKSKKSCPDGFLSHQGTCKPIDKPDIKKECAPGSSWIPRHRGPKGKWIPGHCES